ncbi:xylulokinase [Caviibacterium pharyngocola]|uniref:ATPase n=1 Tax=Caviibacterium pharyngocola TaxID=28159 RepID=A0A2M8RTV7_9PAST|nr:FGGY-family carbohydrate kinase [Caviibacterium pharyngocola]PJG82318.1 ATPase [Caviibacterium pharyngocola]
MQSIKQIITSGKTCIGIEFGSTRIKAVLIDHQGNILASGNFNWENQFVNGIWTYDLNQIWLGLQQAYQALTQNVLEIYETHITQVSSIGISGMMHGYMPFDSHGNLLTPFRTWRNNITSDAAKKLTALFNYNIPQRWSIAHLYQAILNQEDHISQIDYFTTLAGYVHWKLTGEKVLGICEASGMFPIDTQTQNYDAAMIANFNQLIEENHFPWTLNQILPKVLPAGKIAGKLTAEGAKLLDPSGYLQSGIKFCPPEGDAGTGMIATNSIKETTGNISAGTSAFAMIVLEKSLSRVYEQLDIVTTPTGKLVAMAHANNCTTDINVWIKLLSESLHCFGVTLPADKIYETLFNKALEGEKDCGGLLSYGFYSGEHSVDLPNGCPVFLHPTDSHFSLANFMRTHLYSAFGAMKLGMDILIQQEKITISKIVAHGGIFKTPNVASGILAAALNVPIAVMSTASEGGAWGIALLAGYLEMSDDISLTQYLDEIIFKHTDISINQPEPSTVQGYERFIQGYKQNISVAKEAARIYSNT